jgi:hypothetical protein
MRVSRAAMTRTSSALARDAAAFHRRTGRRAMSSRGIDVRRGDTDTHVMSRHCPLVLTLVVIAVIAAGCGGDGSSYAADADAICARVVAGSRALYRTTGAARGPRDRAFSRIVRARDAASTPRARSFARTASGRSARRDEFGSLRRS